MAAAAALALVLLTLAAFAPVLRNGFVHADDDDYITRNAVVRRGLTAEGLALALTSSYAANWHPLTWLSHMLDVELFGLDPRGHHAASVVLHLGSALVLLLTLRSMTGRAGPSFLTAALFAVHPLRVESVAWAAERKDVLSGFFWMLACALYLRHARRPGAGRYLAVLLAFGLGLAAKQMLVTLPLVLLLLDWWPLNRIPRGDAAPARRARVTALLLEKAPLLALAAVAGLVALQVQSRGGAVLDASVHPLDARAANALLSTVRYLAQAAWPAGLAVFYPYVVHPMLGAAALGAAGCIAAAGLAALRLRSRFPWLLAGWGWYLVTLLPVIGLIQVGEQSMADRYTYLPLVGVFLALSWTVAGVLRGHRAAAAALAAVPLVALAGATRLQVEVWRDDLALFGHAVEVTRDNWKALSSLGTALDVAGDRAGALPRYEAALRLRPSALPRVRAAYALALDGAGRTAEAIGEMREAVRALPGDPVVRMQLALLLSREGLHDEAIGHLREILRLRPDVLEAYNNLAVILARRGETGEAATLLRRALEVDPGYAEARLNLEALTGGRDVASPQPPAKQFPRDGL